MSTHVDNPKKVTTQTLRQMKANGERIASLTAYDAAFARVLDQAGCDRQSQRVLLSGLPKMRSGFQQFQSF